MLSRKCILGGGYWLIFVSELLTTHGYASYPNAPVGKWVHALAPGASRQFEQTERIRHKIMLYVSRKLPKRVRE